MSIKNILLLFSLLFFFNARAQKRSDSLYYVDGHPITLSEVIVNNKLNIPLFIERIKNDTSFYKAFRNLRILEFSAINDIRMNDSDGDARAGLRSKTRQFRTASCRRMETLEETATGDIYDENRQFNYYTAQLYASLFFTKDSVCGEDNIVTGREFSTADKSGMEKRKEQLKMLFFNPGKKINGLPFISGKTAVFDEDMAGKYDMDIDMDIRNNTSCILFTQKVKPENKDDVVIDEMTTWFDDRTFEVIARNYSLSYDALVYDFKVRMEVELTHFGTYLVPTLIRYNGNWKAILKKRERGVFTATLFDFK
ncbi:MAG: hypothetical protein IPI66_11815 [Chitinophagaceae bacterium]|nr:hypothetical protein [Chitinophagaceae bacterium]